MAHFENVEQAQAFDDFKNNLEATGSVDNITSRKIPTEEIAKSYWDVIHKKENELIEDEIAYKDAYDYNKERYEELKQEQKALLLQPEPDYDKIELDEKVQKEIDEKYKAKILTLKRLNHDRMLIRDGDRKLRPSNFNKNVPAVYLRSLEDVQTVNIIANHVLVGKFGRGTGKLKLDGPIKEKDLAWINYYKDNPEKIRPHLAILNKNREEINSLTSQTAGSMKLADYDYKNEIKSAKKASIDNSEKINRLREIEAEMKTVASKKLELSDKLTTVKNDLMSLDYNKKFLDKKLEHFEGRKRIASELSKNNPNIKEVVHDGKTNAVVIAVSNVPINSFDGMLSSNNGKINNLFIKENDKLIPITEIKNGSMFDENGKEYETIHYSEMFTSSKQSSRSYNKEHSFVITNKFGDDYKGESTIRPREGIVANGETPEGLI